MMELGTNLIWNIMVEKFVLYNIYLQILLPSLFHASNIDAANLSQPHKF